MLVGVGLVVDPEVEDVEELGPVPGGVVGGDDDALFDLAAAVAFFYELLDKAEDDLLACEEEFGAVVPDAEFGGVEFDEVAVLAEEFEECEVEGEEFFADAVVGELWGLLKGGKGFFKIVGPDVARDRTQTDIMRAEDFAVNPCFVGDDVDGEGQAAFGNTDFFVGLLDAFGCVLHGVKLGD